MDRIRRMIIFGLASTILLSAAMYGVVSSPGFTDQHSDVYFKTQRKWTSTSSSSWTPMSGMQIGAPDGIHTYGADVVITFSGEFMIGESQWFPVPSSPVENGTLASVTEGELSPESIQIKFVILKLVIAVPPADPYWRWFASSENITILTGKPVTPGLESHSFTFTYKGLPIGTYKFLIKWNLYPATTRLDQSVWPPVILQPYAGADCRSLVVTLNTPGH